MVMGLKLAFTLIMLLQQSNVCLPTCVTETFILKHVIPGKLLAKTYSRFLVEDNDFGICFLQCTKDCRCLSFNVCGNQCQLNDFAKEVGFSELEVRRECTYYQIANTKVSYKWLRITNRLGEDCFLHDEEDWSILMLGSWSRVRNYHTSNCRKRDLTRTGIEPMAFRMLAERSNHWATTVKFEEYCRTLTEEDEYAYDVSKTLPNYQGSSNFAILTHQ